MAADTLCVCPMATWLWVCRSVIINIYIYASSYACACDRFPAQESSMLGWTLAPLYPGMLNTILYTNTYRYYHTYSCMHAQVLGSAHGWKHASGVTS